MSSTAARGQLPAASPHLVEFKAGKGTLVGTTVTCEERKGRIILTKPPSDGLVHFQWQPRPDSAIEDDLIVFPGDATFERVPECTTGRVYLFTLGGRKRFFWLQDLKEDKDAENVRKVQDVLRTGSVSAAPAATSEPAAAAATPMAVVAPTTGSAAAVAAPLPPTIAPATPVAPAAAASTAAAATPATPAAATGTASGQQSMANVMATIMNHMSQQQQQHGAH